MNARTTKVPMCKILDPDQETIVNIDGEFYEPIIILGHITELKKDVESQKSLIPKKALISIKRFTIEPTFPFPKFIHWSTSNFSSVKRVIMNFDGSKVLCQICSQSIREALCLFELTDEESIQFDEKYSIRCFRELSQEQKLEFLSKLL